MSLTVLATGPLATIQDLGRFGFAHLGVPRAGALDEPAAKLANRIVGNPESAAVLRAGLGLWVAVTGAPCPVSVDGRQRGFGRAEYVAPGAVLRLGTPTSGVRSYVAVAGGIDVPPVLGSRSTDTLAGIGPAVLAAGQDLPVGAPRQEPQPHDTPRPGRVGPVRLRPGPRRDWFAGDPLAELCAAPYTVLAESNRIGLRLDGAALRRSRRDELPSEGMVLGAVQVPPDGRPVVFLHDHPVTGGYPVVAVVEADDLWVCAQLRPGEQLQFRPAR